MYLTDRSGRLQNLVIVSNSMCSDFLYPTFSELTWRIALDIEKSLTINKDGEAVEEWMDVGNGCICCSVK